MWFQRVIFNFQTRLLGKEEKPPKLQREEIVAPRRRNVERAQLIHERLLDLDRRIEALQ